MSVDLLLQVLKQKYFEFKNKLFVFIGNLQTMLRWMEKTLYSFMVAILKFGIEEYAQSLDGVF